jgi:hypothetical protein
VRKERTSVKHQHLKGFKGNVGKIRTICTSCLKDTKIHKYECDRGVRNEMPQRDQDLTSNKPKLLGEGRGLKKE